MVISLLLLFEISRYVTQELMKIVNDMGRHEMRAMLLRPFGYFSRGMYPT